ncbi:MAG: tryptophan-rich sensory protein [Rhizobiales bacterium]|nr:tryptophan-rich sensory protein [Hyphomicrobiales bacterium]
MSRIASLIGFVVLVVGGGLLIGYLNVPGEWYANLTKPSFNPPNWIFGPVWTILYVFIAIVGWRVWQQNPRGPATFVWTLQLVLNFLWSPVFFTSHEIGLALVIILTLLTTIIVFIVWEWPRDRLVSLLFVPYAAWVAFASLLNVSILMLN